MRNWIVILVVAVVAYFAWRKFGGTVKSAVTNITK
jgi:hypothetical protein